MTIAPEVLGDENDSDKRSGFHLGEDDKDLFAGLLVYFS
jgi:hypothetical protein